jgi:peptide/nickel transport system permease protein
MFRYILRRVLATIPVMGVVAIFVFLMLRLSPGDPAAVIAGDYATSDDIALIREKLGLADPIIVQFWRWIGQIVTGRLRHLHLHQFAGDHTDRPAARADADAGAHHADVLGDRGCAAWHNRGLAGGRLARPGHHGVCVAGFSIPVFVLGYMLIYVIALKAACCPSRAIAR